MEYVYLKRGQRCGGAANKSEDKAIKDIQCLSFLGACYMLEIFDKFYVTEDDKGEIENECQSVWYISDEKVGSKNVSEFIDNEICTNCKTRKDNSLTICKNKN